MRKHQVEEEDGRAHQRIQKRVDHEEWVRLKLIRDVEKDDAAERDCDANLDLADSLVQSLLVAAEAYQEGDGNKGGDDQEEQRDNGFVADQFVGVSGLEHHTGEFGLFEGIHSSVVCQRLKFNLSDAVGRTGGRHFGEEDLLAGFVLVLG